MQEFKEHVARIYDGAPGSRYDISSTRLEALGDFQLILSEVRFPENPITLDVGCGTGLALFELMKRINGKGIFHGVDISKGMIEQARKNAASQGYGNVEFICGDAEKLEFPDAFFDIVVSNQVLHWVPDKAKAVGEMFRVLKQGGQLALQFTGPSFIEGYSIYEGVRKSHPEWALPPFFKFPSLEEAEQLFEEAGFRECKVLATVRLCYCDPARFINGKGNTTWWQAGIAPGVVEKAKSEMIMESMKKVTAKGFKTTQTRLLVYAKKSK